MQARAEATKGHMGLVGLEEHTEHGSVKSLRRYWTAWLSPRKSSPLLTSDTHQDHIQESLPGHQQKPKHTQVFTDVLLTSFFSCSTGIYIYSTNNKHWLQKINCGD